MLLPSIVVIDRNSLRGNEVLSHLEDVLTTLPQPILIVIEVRAGLHGAIWVRRMPSRFTLCRTASTSLCYIWLKTGC